MSPASRHDRPAQTGAERRELKPAYRDLFKAAAALLFEHDPIGINFGHNSDEYEPEVGTILPRLRECSGPADVRRVVHEEFVRWFEPVDVGGEHRYQAIGDALWRLWCSAGRE